MSTDVILLGCGGHAKVAADIVLCCGDRLIGFLDDDPEKTTLLGAPRLGALSDWTRYADAARFLSGIGANQLRETLARELRVRWHTAVHPSAVIGAGVSIGAGSVVMANASVNTDTVIGRHCIVNTGAVVEHDNRVADFVHISPHATLCGTVSVGARTHIGAGACVINNLSVCADAVVGAGAVVVRSITEPGVYAGVPARRLA